MMGKPIDGPCYTFSDNMSVIRNTSKPESCLQKKSNYICFHAIHEVLAMGELLIAHESTTNNLANLATKVLPGGQ
jgi:hypothetical protein